MTRYLKTDNSNLKEFEERSKKWRKYKLKLDLHPTSLAGVIYYMVFNYQPTFTLRDNNLQCPGARKRSVEDVFRVCKSYCDNITLKQVKKAMDKLVTSGKMARNYCYIVQKMVHYPRSVSVDISSILTTLEKDNVKFGSIEKIS